MQGDGTFIRPLVLHNQSFQGLSEDWLFKLETYSEGLNCERRKTIQNQKIGKQTKNQAKNGHESKEWLSDCFQKVEETQANKEGEEEEEGKIGQKIVFL